MVDANGHNTSSAGEEEEMVAKRENQAQVRRVFISFCNDLFLISFFVGTSQTTRSKSKESRDTSL